MKLTAPSLSVAAACLLASVFWAKAGGVDRLAAHGPDLQARVAPMETALPGPASALAASASLAGSLPVALSVIIAVPLAAGAVLLRASRPKRPLACPVCGSVQGAWVGQVGDSRNNYRCHTCGFLCEPCESPELFA